jgi:hypothetical protein
VSGRSLVQRSPTECGVSECYREASVMERDSGLPGGSTIFECYFVYNKNYLRSVYKRKATENCNRFKFIKKCAMHLIIVTNNT